MGVGHLYIIAEHIVIPYLQTRDTGGLTFAGLQLQQIILAGISYVAQLVELSVDP